MVVVNNLIIKIKKVTLEWTTQIEPIYNNFMVIKGTRFKWTKQRNLNRIGNFSVRKSIRDKMSDVLYRYFSKTVFLK